jgi:hypothetical protein
VALAGLQGFDAFLGGLYSALNVAAFLIAALGIGFLFGWGRL